MSVGIYGSKTLATCDFNDVDILYAYSPNRESIGEVQYKPMYGSVTENEFRKMLGVDGSYKLRLPATIFNKLGFYTVMIKPKSFQTQIIDCSFVVTNNQTEIQISKKGIVIPKLSFQNTGSLIGYKIEYFDDNNVKIKNFHRIITSSDPVVVSTNNNNSNPNSTSYNLNSNGNYLFLTLSPDESSLISNTQKPDLGKAGQTIIISNTFFDPVMIEVEMVDQNIKTLSYILTGNSTRDLKTGKITYFDENNLVYKQFLLNTRKNTFTDANIDVKEEVKNIDQTQTFNDLIGQ